MSRLTRKDVCNYDLTYSNGDFVRGICPNDKINSGIYIQGMNKLGKLEDLEEELGCPLEVVFKALKQGYIYVDMEIFEHPRRTLKDIKKQKVNFINFEGTYFHIGYVHDYSVAICDYGVSWWLKSEVQGE